MDILRVTFALIFQFASFHLILLTKPEYLVKALLKPAFVVLISSTD